MILSKFSYYTERLKLKYKVDSAFFIKDRVYEAVALSGFDFTKQGKVFTTYTDYMVKNSFGNTYILTNRMMKQFKIEVE